MNDNVKLFKTINGEMVLTEVEGVTDEGMYILIYPAVIIPIPPEQAGGQRNQVGFGKYLPFTDYGKDILMNPDSVSIDSEPNSSMLNAYQQWVTQMRAQESGIVMAQPGSLLQNQVKDGAARDFSQLNTGR